MKTYKQLLYNKKCIWFALVLVLFPIFEPYAISENIGIMICDVIVIFILCFFIKKRKIIIYKPLFIILLLNLGLSVLAAIFTQSSQLDIILAIKVFIVFLMYLVVFSCMWDNEIKEAFYRVVVIVGVISAVLAIAQFIFANLGFAGFYSGRLPFAIGKYNAFGGLFDANTGDVRVHSFFEEPSYLAIYQLPITAYCISRKKYIFALITGISCVISGSMLGVVGIFIVLLNALILEESLSGTRKLKLLFAIAIVLFSIYILYLFNTQINTLVNYYVMRYTKLGRDLTYFSESSASQRLLGNIRLFSKYGILNKLIGVGINQYPLYFGLSSDYSNDFVCTILNYGFIGLVSLFCFLFQLFYNTKRSSLIYLALFILVLGVDHSWFGPYFFYLLTWCIFELKSDSMIRIRI